MLPGRNINKTVRNSNISKSEFNFYNSSSYWKATGHWIYSSFLYFNKDPSRALPFNAWRGLKTSTKSPLTTQRVICKLGSGHQIFTPVQHVCLKNLDRPYKRPFILGRNSVNLGRFFKTEISRENGAVFYASIKL